MSLSAPHVLDTSMVLTIHLTAWDALESSTLALMAFWVATTILVAGAKVWVTESNSVREET